MKWACPFWLYGIPLFIIGWILVVWLLWHLRKKALRQFASETMLQRFLLTHYSSTRFFVKNALMGLAIVFILISLARPQWGYFLRENHARGIDILFALDTSRSMLVRDVKPNRLENAKLAILDFIGRIKGDRIGLIAFSGEAFLQCPLTLDYDAFRQALEAVDTHIIPVGGTNMGGAIVEAQKVFSGGSHFKILVLITDGEDLEGRALAEAQKAHQIGAKVYTVGIGSPQGDIIPVEEAGGDIDYVRDPSGKIVKSRLDADLLAKIADTTGGFYVPMGIAGEGLTAVYERGLGSIPKEVLGETVQKVPIERYTWFLWPALLLLMLESLLNTRKKLKIK